MPTSQRCRSLSAGGPVSNLTITPSTLSGLRRWVPPKGLSCIMGVTTLRKTAKALSIVCRVVFRFHVLFNTHSSALLFATYVCTHTNWLAVALPIMVHTHSAFGTTLPCRPLGLRRPLPQFCVSRKAKPMFLSVPSLGCSEIEWCSTAASARRPQRQSEGSRKRDEHSPPEPMLEFSVPRKNAALSPRRCLNFPCSGDNPGCAAAPTQTVGCVYRLQPAGRCWYLVDVLAA